MNQITFIVRSDVAGKPGGDTQQVREYIDVLTSTGVKAVELQWSPALSFSDEAIIYANLDRPYEFLDLMRRAGNRPVSLLSIHHSDSDVRRLRAGESKYSRQRKLVNSLPFPLREYLTFARRLLKSEAPAPSKLAAASRALWDMCRLRPEIGLALGRCETVFFLSEKERRSVASDYFAEVSNYQIVPNGIPPIPEENFKGWGDREIAIVVVGRIEPRKRQLELLRTANLLSVPITFIGKIDMNAGSYASQFSTEILESPTCNWLGQLDHDEVVAILGNSRVLLNASWAEVQSLVELEAASAGCFIVTSDSGSTREYISTEIAHVALVSEDLTDLVRIAFQQSTSASPPPQFSYLHSWESSTKTILEAIQPPKDTVNHG